MKNSQRTSYPPVLAPTRPKHVRVASLVLLAFFFCSKLAFCQTPDSLAPPVSAFPERYLGLTFEHVLSLYDWQANALIMQPLSVANANAYRFLFNADSRLQEQTSLLSSTVTTSLMFQHRFGASDLLIPTFSLYGTSYATSTPAGALPSPSLIRNQIDGYAVGGVTSHIPSSSIQITASGGIARQSQSTTSSSGPMLLASLDSLHETLSDATALDGGASLDERFFQNRPQRFSNDELHLVASTQLGRAHNLFALQGTLGRRDFFYQTDSTEPETKQERQQLALSLLDSLRAPIIIAPLTGLALIQFEPQSITRTSDATMQVLTQSSTAALSTLLVPNEVSIFQFRGLGALDLTPISLGSGQITMHAELQYQEHDEDVLLRSADLASLDASLVRKYTDALQEASFASRITSTALNAYYLLQNGDTASITASERLLNYDTPSGTNTDDHDELLSAIRVGFSNRWSPALYGAISLYGSRNHLVYLMSDRSAQNNITNSLLLATDAAYQSASWSNAIHAEVYANYTVLDYLDSLPILQGVGSYVIRGLTIQDTSRIALGHLGPTETGLEWLALARISERGSYQEQAFTEQRSNRVTEITASMLATIEQPYTKANWLIKLGVQAFYLLHEAPSGSSELTTPLFSALERQTRIGPYLQIDLLRQNGFGPMLSGSIWYAILRDEQIQSAITYQTPRVESYLTVQWRF